MSTTLTWQERAKATEKYHKSCLQEDNDHTVQKTAEALERSIGRVSEDLTLAEWMKKDDRVSRFEYAKDALEYVKKRKLEAKLS